MTCRNFVTISAAVFNMATASMHARAISSCQRHFEVFVLLTFLDDDDRSQRVGRLHEMSLQ